MTRYRHLFSTLGLVALLMTPVLGQAEDGYWDKATEITRESWEATRKGAKEAADWTSEKSSKAWEATKEGAADASEWTREKAARAWEATREGTASALDSLKGEEDAAGGEPPRDRQGL